MATRQYIGARYVIKVYENSLDPSSAEWEPSVTYEPLTLVTYNNSSYLSKKDVPGSVGDPAANPYYWVVTGAYNGQIAYLQSEIDTINEDITEIKTRKIMLIGDSYGTHNGNGVDTVATSLPEAIKAYIGSQVSNVYDAFVNGAGFCNGGYLLALQSLYDADNVDIDDIYVIGGWNDEDGRSGTYAGVPYTVTEANTYTAMEAFMVYCHTTYPSAKVHLIFCANGVYSASPFYDTNIIHTWQWYMNSTVYNYIYHDDAANVLHDADLMFPYDGLHPNQDGVYALGKAITSIIEYGSCSYNERVETLASEFSAVTGTTNNAVVCNLNILEYVTEKGIHIHFTYDQTKALLIGYDTPQSVTFNGSLIELLNKPCKATIGFGQFVNIPVGIEVVADESGNTVIYNYTGNLVFAPEKIYLLLPYVPQTDLTPKTHVVIGIIVGRGSTFTNDKFY